MSIETVLRFAQLGLSAPILQAIDEIGYEMPSPIQARTIPTMIAGRDLIGQAQTGTGKTAAFALPILCNVDTHRRTTQALILTPTRELAIQVAEAIHAYGRHVDGLHVLPVYGGQHIGAQLRPLQRGVHVVVGTPGRIIDHLERGTLKLDAVETVVLDEADEMLRMGFIEDVDRILECTPESKQVALFSATMPRQVRRIADRHLQDPELITIETATTTVDTVRQRYLIAPWRQKLDAMTRILETTDFNAMLIFVRTKVATLEVSEKLEARGHASAALNGDMPQAQRERTVQRLRDGALDIVVATDVAARGLDVSRISHVVNYDIPNDTEAYVHRIGRTGRAGRDGEAILLVQPREQRMLKVIERATGQRITPMPLPTSAAVTDHRVARFKKTVQDTIESQDLEFFDRVLTELRDEQDVSMEKIAAALAFIVQQERPLKPPAPTIETRDHLGQRGDFDKGRARYESRSDRSDSPRHDRGPAQESWVSYRLEVGHQDGAQPRHIVGAITNELGIDGRRIGRIKVLENYTIVDLPADMPPPIFRKLQSVEIFGRPFRASSFREPKRKYERDRVNGASSKPGGYSRTSDDAKPRHPRSGHPKSGHPKSGHPKSGYPKSGYPKTAHAKPAHAKSAHAKSANGTTFTKGRKFAKAGKPGKGAVVGQIKVKGKGQGKGKRRKANARRG